MHIYIPTHILMCELRFVGDPLPSLVFEARVQARLPRRLMYPRPKDQNIKLNIRTHYFRLDNTRKR